MIIASIKKGFGVATSSMALVGLLFVFGAVWTVVNIGLTPPESAAQAEALARSVVIVLIALVFMLISLFLQAGSMGYVLEKIKTGKSTFGTLAQAGKRFYVRLLLLALLVAAVVGGLIVLAGVSIAVLGAVNNILGTIVGLVLAALGIYLAILIFLAPYAIVVDNAGVKDAIRGSVGLVRRHILRVLGVTGLLLLIGFALGLLLGLIIGVLGIAITGQPKAVELVSGVLSSLVNSFLGVIVTASFMSLYLALKNNNTHGAQ